MTPLTVAVLLSLQRVEYPFEPPMVTVPTAAHDPQYWDSPIEICGHVVRSQPSGNILMYGRGRWLLVDAGTAESLPVWSAACVKAVVRRRDGLSAAEARARGIPRIYVSHGADPDLILHLCSDQSTCEALVPRDR